MVITIDTKAVVREITAELHRLPLAESPPADRTYQSAVEFAETMKVSVRLVRRWLALGMPSVHVGRVRRVIVADAQRWLAAGGGKGAAARAGLAAARWSGLRAMLSVQNAKVATVFALMRSRPWTGAFDLLARWIQPCPTWPIVVRLLASPSEL